MPTIRAYLDGRPPETAVSAEGHTTAVALRKAVKKLGLRATSKATNVENVSSRHRVIEWAGVRVHVLAEARAGTTRNTVGLRRLEVWVSPEADAGLERLEKRLGSKRAAVEWALTQAPDPSPGP